MHARSQGPAAADAKMAGPGPSRLRQRHHPHEESTAGCSRAAITPRTYTTPPMRSNNWVRHPTVAYRTALDASHRPQQLEQRPSDRPFYGGQSRFAPCIPRHGTQPVMQRPLCQLVLHFAAAGQLLATLRAELGLQLLQPDTRAQRATTWRV